MVKKMSKEEMKDRIARAEEIQRYTENRCEALETELKELKKKNEQLKSECRTCVYTDSPCVLSDYPSKNGVCSHYKNVFDENTELQKGLSVLNASNSFNKEQLIQAKELIKNLMHSPRECISWYDLYNKAEQFLKDIKEG